MRSEDFWAWFEGECAPKLDIWPGMQRSATFRKMFEHLDSFDRPVLIVETGCIERVNDDGWAGNGCSTVLFDRYVAAHPGSGAYSVDIIMEKVLQARLLCPNVSVSCDDSVAYLKDMAQSEDNDFSIDLLYLDASDHNWLRPTSSQVHHYNELMAAMPLLRARSMVAVDDSVLGVDDYPQLKVSGKGGLVAQHAFEIGATMEFCQYQIGFSGINAKPPTVEKIDDLVARARACFEAGNDAGADRLYYLILNLTQGKWTDGKARIAWGEACAKFGYTAHATGRWGYAIDWFSRAVQADPFASDYRIELVKSLVAFGAMDKALREAKLATEFDPESPKAWRKLGDVLADRKDADGSMTAYEKELQKALLQADAVAIADAYLNIGTIALDTADYDRVRKCLDQMHQSGQRIGDAYHMEAMLAYRESRHEDAIGLFEMALAHQPRNVPLVHWDMALPFEALGRLKEAGEHKCWNEHERTVPAIMMPQHRFNKPKWRGAEMPLFDEKGEPRKIILHIHTEAGFGDNIAMWRYFPILLELGYEVHYECETSLVSLCQRNFPDVMVMPPCIDHPGVVGIKPFDYHLPIGDLMHAMDAGFGIAALPPMTEPYVKADPKLVADYAALLKNVIKGRKIGLCWSSGIRLVSIWMTHYGRSKSMKLRDMLPIIDAGTDAFVSLQVGDGRDEIDRPCVMPILDILPEKPTWDETAALIANLDLVITVDTGIAHLAGAMGKPCWVVMQKDGTSWHFMCERPGALWNDASPWYPSIRVFRQHEQGRWKDVVDDVAKELSQCSRDLLLV